VNGVRPPHEEAAAGIAELEGYLSWQAEVGTARCTAAAFTADLPWLTTAQREELAERYVRDRLRLTHRFQAALAEHRRTLQVELEAEYATRYQQSRQRLICATLCTLAALASFSLTTLLLTSHA
jgi:hypothetical protein